MKILIKNGTVISPLEKIDGKRDVLIEDGRIAKVAENLTDRQAKILDAKNMVVAPGFVDMHAHLREPGREDAETIESAARSAASGGFTDVCAMPDTQPVMDNQGAIEFLTSKARRLELIRIWPVGAITKGCRGEEISEMAELKRAGCVALSDDDCAVDGKSSIMRHAMEYASMCGIPLICHCEDRGLSRGGVVNEGLYSTVLGLKGIPRFAEFIRVLRDAELAKMTGAQVHMAHLSTRESVNIIRNAKKEGVNITAEVCPHHFTLTDESLTAYDTHTKVNPPLRTAEDIIALKEGLRDGTIDAIATDHSPIVENEKNVEFDSAPFGMIGFETALPLGIMRLVDEKILTLNGLVEKLSTNPARILGLGPKTFKEGQEADIVVFDPQKEWIYDREKIISKSHNTPFIGQKLKGKVIFLQAGTRILLGGEKLSA